MKLLPKILPRNDAQRRIAIERALLQKEAQIGSQLFGPIPKGHTRQFFCLDEQTWIWYEAWQDEQGKEHTVTTKYDVRPGGILKSQNGQRHQLVSAREGLHLIQAAELYEQRVLTEYRNNRIAVA